MATFGRHLTNTMAALSLAMTEIECATDEKPSNDTYRDLWRIYHEIETQMRQLTMVGRENGLDLPVYWIREVDGDLDGRDFY